MFILSWLAQPLSPAQSTLWPSEYLMVHACTHATSDRIRYTTMQSHCLQNMG